MRTIIGILDQVAVAAWDKGDTFGTIIGFAVSTVIFAIAALLILAFKNKA